ncbi:MAG: response regulator [Myxococcota bacterium]
MTDISAPVGRPSSPDSPGPALQKAKARVLIVDDEPTYREYLSSYLGRLGFDVRTAETGPEAIEIAGQFDPDVLLADWMLRCEMHGMQVGEQLRRSSPNLKILLMTGFPTASLEAEASRVGINGFLEKPFALNDLAEAVEVALA